MDTLGGFDGPPLESAFPASYLTGSDGRVDLNHFWFYSMLAAPEVWMLEAVGLNPCYAFTLLNIGLLLIALWVASSRLSWPALMLPFLSPIIWWLDKAHTEIFTFSMLTIAMTLIVNGHGGRWCPRTRLNAKYADSLLDSLDCFDRDCLQTNDSA